MNLDYRISFINDQARLNTLCEGLASVPALALDIETINWWSPQAERVAVVDALARLDPATLRRPLELSSTTKVIHNAAFDATRLARHFKISAAPVHDTMLAARRGGERRCSLKAQAEQHLRLRLDKEARQSDWGQRPLHPKQLSYAALDAVATLLLYEHQTRRGLKGDYRPRAVVGDEQVALPLGSSLPRAVRAEEPARADRPAPAGAGFSA